MKIETLKVLIENILEREHISPDVRNELMMVINLYEQEQESVTPPHTFAPFIPTPGFVVCEPDQVPYGELCSCNPKNGGSGICGCVMGNKMVPNPKKQGYGTNYTSTTTDITNSDFLK